MRRPMISGVMVAVVMLLLPALAASAQSTGQTSQDATTGQAPPVTSPNERKANRVQGPGTKAPSGPREKPGDGPDLDDDEIDELEPGKRDAAIYRKLAKEEEKYRKRRAQIERLRALATEKGQQQRLVAIDKLEGKIEAVYQKKTAKWRARLDDAKYKRMKERLEKGRKGRGGGKPDDRGAGKSRDGDRGTGTSNERSTGKGKGGGKPDDRGPGTGTSNQRGPGSGSQGKGAGGKDNDRGKGPGGKDDDQGKGAGGKDNDRGKGPKSGNKGGGGR